MLPTPRVRQCTVFQSPLSRALQLADAHLPKLVVTACIDEVHHGGEAATRIKYCLHHLTAWSTAAACTTTHRMHAAGLSKAGAVPDRMRSGRQAGSAVVPGTLSMCYKATRQLLGPWSSVRLRLLHPKLIAWHMQTTACFMEAHPLQVVLHCTAHLVHGAKHSSSYSPDAQRVMQHESPR